MKEAEEVLTDLNITQGLVLTLQSMQALPLCWSATRACIQTAILSLMTSPMRPAVSMVAKHKAERGFSSAQESLMNVASSIHLWGTIWQQQCRLKDCSTVRAVEHALYTLP